jgi:hypothetical protein
VTEVIVTPRLAESRAASPPRYDIAVWEAASDATTTAAWTMVLPAVTWRVMSAMVTPIWLARLVRNCSATLPVKSEGSPAMAKVAATTNKADPPGG